MAAVVTVGTAAGGEFWGALSDMWIWDGGNWRPHFPEELPPARFGANMVYDKANKTIVLFGGAVGGGFRDDTWVWDGTSWIEQHPLHHPAGRSNYGMAYDEARQQAVLFGGQTYPDANPSETWVWDGKDWKLLSTRQSPPDELASGAQLVYIPRFQTMILYNDFSQKVTTPNIPIIIERSEVWKLSYQDLIYLPIVLGK